MHHYSLFDSFFSPPTIVVVSEERLKEAERKQKQKQLDSLDERIKQLTEYREELSQKLGEDDAKSLEEALTGE